MTALSGVKTILKLIKVNSINFENLFIKINPDWWIIVYLKDKNIMDHEKCILRPYYPAHCLQL